MNYLKTAALAVLGTVALTVGASAAVVCNEDGDCWRTKERLTYPPDARVQIYGDDYALGPNTGGGKPVKGAATIVAAFGSASKVNSRQRPQDEVPGAVSFAHAILRCTTTLLTNTSDFGIDLSMGVCVQE